MGDKMHWSEAEAVVRAYRAEHGAAADVDVATLASALGTDVAEVRRLAGRRRRFTDGSGVLSAGIALALAALALLAVGSRSIAKEAAFASLQPPVAPEFAPMPAPPDFAPPIPNHTLRVEIIRAPDEPL